MSQPIGARPGAPLYVRMVTDDAGGLRPGRIIAAVLLTAGLAWLSVAVQRGLSGPDVARTVRMGTAHRIKLYADARSAFWGDLSARAATAYQKARMQ